jgi:hypothetical protein
MAAAQAVSGTNIAPQQVGNPIIGTPPIQVGPSTSIPLLQSRLTPQQASIAAQLIMGSSQPTLTSPAYVSPSKSTPSSTASSPGGTILSTIGGIMSSIGQIVAPGGSQPKTNVPNLINTGGQPAALNVAPSKGGLVTASSSSSSSAKIVTPAPPAGDPYAGLADPNKGVTQTRLSQLAGAPAAQPKIDYYSLSRDVQSELEPAQLAAFSEASQKVLQRGSAGRNEQTKAFYAKAQKEYIDHMRSSNLTAKELKSWVSGQLGKIKSIPTDLFQKSSDGFIRGANTYATMKLGIELGKTPPATVAAAADDEEDDPDLSMMVTTGKGLKKRKPAKAPKMKLKLKRRSFYGSGSTAVLQTKSKKFHMLSNYYIDLNKLDDDSILSVKYTKNDAPHPNIKVQKINSETRDVIKDILDNKFNKRLFEKMQTEDRRIVSNFVKRCKLDVDLPEDSFDRDFQLLKGEWIAGNDNPDIKKQLRKYVLIGQQEGRLPRSQAMMILYQLSL